MKLFILFLFLSFSTVAQYISGYAPFINEAELAICDSSYTKALKAYQTAFSAVDTPFSSDYENAAKCAFLTFDSGLGKFYLRKLVARGYTVAQFENDVQGLLFREALQDPIFKKELQEEYKNYSKRYFASLGMSQNKELMHHWMKYNRWLNEPQKVDSLIVTKKFFADFLKKEWEVGFPKKDDVLKNLLFVEYLKDTTIEFKTPKDFEKKIIIAVDEGRLSGEDAYQILKNRYSSFLQLSDFLFIKVSYNPYLCPDKEKLENKIDKWLINNKLIASGEGQKIDKLRTKIGYESLKDELRKRQFSMQCNDEGNFDLRCPRNYTHYPTSCQELHFLVNELEVF